MKFGGNDTTSTSNSHEFWESLMRYGWQLDPESWKRVRFLSDQSWRHIPFDTLHARMVPERPGIYAVCSKVPAGRPPSGIFRGLYNALYVGKSDLLRQRFLQHCNNPKPEITHLRLCFPSSQFWFLELPRNEIADAEDALIDCLGPSANLRRGIRGRIGKPKSL